MVPAQGAAPALPFHLRLLPHLRRSGRRGRRPLRGAGAARSVGPRTRRLLRGPRAPSGFCRAGRNHPRLLHSQRALRRSARRLPPGSDRHPLRHHGRCARLLPLLGQSRRPPGALCLRRSARRRKLPPLRRHLLRPATGQLLAGCARRFREGPRLPSAGRHAPLRRERRDHRAAASPRRSFARCCATKSTSRARSSSRACRSSAA